MPEELDAQQRKLVADRVRQRRLALGLSIDEAAGSVGMSAVTWGRVEKGMPVRSLTYAGIERALAWQPGAVEGLTAGQEPTNVAEAKTQDRVGMRDHVRAVMTVADDSPIDTLIFEIYSSEMPEERKQELVRMIRLAEARRDAEMRAAQDELSRWRSKDTG